MTHKADKANEAREEAEGVSNKRERSNNRQVGNCGSCEIEGGEC